MTRKLKAKAWFITRGRNRSSGGKSSGIGSQPAQSTDRQPRAKQHKTKWNPANHPRGPIGRFINK